MGSSAPKKDAAPVDPTSFLEKMNLALSREVNTDQLTEARNAFFNGVVNTRMTVRVNNSETEKDCSEENVREVTDLFLGQMMGLSAYQRLRALITTYISADLGGIDRGAAAGAEAAAGDPNQPEAVRRFCDTFARAQRAEKTSSSHLASIERTAVFLTLLKRYERLQEDASSRDPAVLRRSLPPASRRRQVTRTPARS